MTQYLKQNWIEQAYYIYIMLIDLQQEQSAGVFNRKNIYKLLWSWGYKSIHKHQNLFIFTYSDG